MKSSRLVFTLKDAGRLFRVRDPREVSSVPLHAEGLSFERVSITDVDIAKLPVLAQLRCLDLDGTRVTDASLEWVCSLPALEELWLEETGVTDAGIQRLRSNAYLKFVSVAYTLVTPAGAEALQARRDGLEVSL